MRLLVPSLLLLMFVLSSCETNAQPKLSITVAEFNSKLQSGSHQVLDVRTAGEYKTGHLENALQADWLNKQQFEERVKYLDKSKPVLVYCASGVRSEQAAKWLLKQGFSEVFNLKGGISAWQLEGKQLEAETALTQMAVNTFQQKINVQGFVLVDVGAEWCPPCKKMEPILLQLQQDMGSKYQLVKVDGGTDIEVMKTIKATVLPTFILYKAGKEVWRKEGIVDLETLKSKLQ
ncbi:MAG: rhodanese-like domain-containing protein [Bacteroidota bacterium]|jgi:rhodanese-related sulfurtransferase